MQKPLSGCSDACDNKKWTKYLHFYYPIFIILLHAALVCSTSTCNQHSYHCVMEHIYHIYAVFGGFVFLLFLSPVDSLLSAYAPAGDLTHIARAVRLRRVLWEPRAPPRQAAESQHRKWVLRLPRAGKRQNRIGSTQMRAFRAQSVTK